MNVYHKILVKLYNETAGKTSEKVDFINLVKNEGFYPSYKDILNQLNTQGWIVEAGRDSVSITPWGIKEAKKVSSGETGTKNELLKASNRLKTEVKELLVLAEGFLSDSDEENLKLIESKLNDINNAINNVKQII